MSSPTRLDNGKDRSEPPSSSGIEPVEEHKEESRSATVPLTGLALGKLTVAGKHLPIPQVKHDLLEEAPHLESMLRGDELDLILAYLETRNYSCTLLSQLYGATMNLHKEFAAFSAEASNPQTWAVLHRLRGGQEKRGFSDFLRAKSWHPMDRQDMNDSRAEWGKTNGKYEPANFGGNHSWPRNADWLKQILGRRVILTDVPLRRSNLMCKVDDDGKPVDGFEGNKHFGVPSAYAREIAALLADGYVGLWGHELKPTFDQLGIPQSERAVAVQTFVMVPDPGKYADKPGNIPPQLYEVLNRRRHAQRKYLKGIAGGVRVLPDQFGELIGALEMAGMPVVNPTDPQELGARIVEAQERQKVADEHQRRAELGHLTSTKGAERLEQQQRGAEKRLSSAVASSEILAQGPDRQEMESWLLGRLRDMGRTRKQCNPNGQQCATLVEEGKKLGWFGASFSAASLKRYIKDELLDRLPN